MVSSKTMLRIILTILACVVVIGLGGWMVYQSKHRIKGNPEVPPVSEEAVRMDKMFNKLSEKSTK